jgi:hypothetical protein
MAQRAGISEASVRRIWHAHGLKPHLTRTFKLSRDPEFADKLEDIVGLYLKPPEHAIVLCADEKSQILLTITTTTQSRSSGPPRPPILEKVKRARAALHNRQSARRTTLGVLPTRGKQNLCSRHRP